MKRCIWKRAVSAALAVMLALPAAAWAQAEEPENAEDLLAFSGAVSDMIREYGLEAPAGDVSLADAEWEEFASGRLIVKAAGEIDPLDALSVAEGYDDLHVLQFADVAEGYDDLHVLQFADAAAAAAAFEVYEAMDGVEYGL